MNIHLNQITHVFIFLHNDFKMSHYFDLIFSTGNSLNKVLTGHFTNEWSVWIETNKVNLFFGIKSSFLCQDVFFALMQWGRFYMLQISVDILYVNVVRIINWGERERKTDTVRKKWHESASRGQRVEGLSNSTWQRFISALQMVKFRIDFPQRKNWHTTSFPKIHDTIDDLTRYLHGNMSGPLVNDLLRCTLGYKPGVVTYWCSDCNKSCSKSFLWQCFSQLSASSKLLPA